MNYSINTKFFKFLYINRWTCLNMQFLKIKIINNKKNMKDKQKVFGVDL